MTRKRLLTFAFFASAFAEGLSVTMFGPSFESLARQFGLPLSNAGLFTLIQWFGITMMVLATGFLPDRFKTRYVLGGGGVMMGCGLLLLATAQTLPIALIGALLSGLRYGVLDVSGYVVLSALYPGRSAPLLSQFGFFYGLGAIFGQQLVGVALTQADFRLAFIATSLLAFTLIIPFAGISLYVQSDWSTSRKRTIPWQFLAPFALILFTFVGLQNGFSNWIFTQLSLVAHSTNTTAALGASLFWIGLTVSRAIASVGLRRFAAGQVLRAAAVIVLVTKAIIMLVPASINVILVCCFVIGFGSGPIFPTAVAIGRSSVLEARGTITGLLVAAGTMGGTIPPWLQGLVGGGNNGGMIVILVLAVILVGVSFVLPYRAAVSTWAQATQAANIGQ